MLNVDNNTDSNEVFFIVESESLMNLGCRNEKLQKELHSVFS